MHNDTKVETVMGASQMTQLAAATLGVLALGYVGVRKWYESEQKYNRRIQERLARSDEQVKEFSEVVDQFHDLIIANQTMLDDAEADLRELEREEEPNAILEAQSKKAAKKVIGSSTARILLNLPVVNESHSKPAIDPMPQLKVNEENRNVEENNDEDEALIVATINAYADPSLDNLSVLNN
ncbi:MAG: hypothetical protein M3R00_04830 [Pseudomonadota bacterium]|nr:hypothetical protein [Pseudomonadota bacterium]